MDRKPYGRPFAEPSCLFPSDEEIARVLFGNDKARIKLFEETVAAEERRGLPRKHPTYGARYWPAVKAYFDYEWGLVADRRLQLRPMKPCRRSMRSSSRLRRGGAHRANAPADARSFCDVQQT
jgi:hypothetical protein